MAEKMINLSVDHMDCIRILAGNSVDPQADTNPLERENNQLVHQLYGLTEEEIAIVENKT